MDLQQTRVFGDGPGRILPTRGRVEVAILVVMVWPPHSCRSRSWFLPSTAAGRDPGTERNAGEGLAESSFEKQRVIRRGLAFAAARTFWAMLRVRRPVTRVTSA